MLFLTDMINVTVLNVSFIRNQGYKGTAIHITISDSNTKRSVLT